MIEWVRGPGRVWAITVATAVVASGLGFGIALVGGGDGRPARSTPTPVATPRAIETPDADESPTPTSSPQPTASPAAIASPSPTVPPTEDAESVACNVTPKFCSNLTGRMTVRNDRLTAQGQVEHSTDYSDVPTPTMTWQLLKSDGSQAQSGDRVTKVRVLLVLENKTANRTFVFPRREFVLDVTRNGELMDPVKTTGPSFEMPPGARVDTAFEVPINSDGSYEWRAKTWFYEG